jgi:hypothetical protein
MRRNGAASSPRHRCSASALSHRYQSDNSFCTLIPDANIFSYVYWDVSIPSGLIASSPTVLTRLGDCVGSISRRKSTVTASAHTSILAVRRNAATRQEFVGNHPIKIAHQCRFVARDIRCEN